MLIIYQLCKLIIYFIFSIYFMLNYRPLYISHAFHLSALVKSIECTVFFFTFMDPLEFHFKHFTTNPQFKFQDQLFVKKLGS